MDILKKYCVFLLYFRLKYLVSSKKHIIKPIFALCNARKIEIKDDICILVKLLPIANFVE